MGIFLLSWSLRVLPTTCFARGAFGLCSEAFGVHGIFLITNKRLHELLVFLVKSKCTRPSCDSARIEGAGAICCDNNNVEDALACRSAELSVRTSSECQNDICCSGDFSCQDATFVGDGFIRSLSCEGPSSCQGVSTSPVSGDLICQGFQVCEDIQVDFDSDVPAEHAITCDGEVVDACTNSIFRFYGVAWCQDHGKSCHLCVFQRDV